MTSFQQLWRIMVAQILTSRGLTFTYPDLTKDPDCDCWIAPFDGHFCVFIENVECVCNGNTYSVKDLSFYYDFNENYEIKDVTPHRVEYRSGSNPQELKSYLESILEDMCVIYRRMVKDILLHE